MRHGGDKLRVGRSNLGFLALMRWSRGYLQVFKGYGIALMKGMFQGSFSCFDMSMSILPAFVLSICSMALNIILGVKGACLGGSVVTAIQSVGSMLGSFYISFFGIGAITTLTEWKHIYTTPVRKITYIFTFPLFMFTYIPISFAALFVDPGWKPISHSETFAVPTRRGLTTMEKPY